MELQSAGNTGYIAIVVMQQQCELLDECCRTPHVSPSEDPAKLPVKEHGVCPCCSKVLQIWTDSVHGTNLHLQACVQLAT